MHIFQWILLIFKAYQCFIHVLTHNYLHLLTLLVFVDRDICFILLLQSELLLELAIFLIFKTIHILFDVICRQLGDLCIITRCGTMGTDGAGNIARLFDFCSSDILLTIVVREWLAYHMR